MGVSEHPLISVIVPLYRPGALLPSVIDNLSSLTYSNLEFIFVDDGSADGTAERLKASVAGLASHRVVELPNNRGPAGARNAGMREASGEYVWFVDWDDVWRPDILDLLHAAAVEHNADIVVGRARWASSAEDKYGSFADGLGRSVMLDRGTALEYVLLGHIKGYLWNKLFRRTVLGSSPFPDMRTQEDLCCVVAAIGKSERIASVSETVYWHVVRAGSVTHSRNPELVNLRIARDWVAEECARALQPGPRHSRLQLHYDYAFWLVSWATTAARLSDSATRATAIREVQRRMRVREILMVARVSPGVGAKAALIKLLGAGFVTLRKVVIALRPANALRR